MDDITFEPFPKLSRISRSVIITEKLDGTNAQVIVTNDGRVGAASRNRLIRVGDDNYGFAAWVEENKDELVKLGPGRHFGEWYGKGIQRGYGLANRRFALFNTGRWSTDRPACCDVVPVLKVTDQGFVNVDEVMHDLWSGGSVAVPGYRNPEGIVLFHTASGTLYKKTFEHDSQGKWAA